MGGGIDPGSYDLLIQAGEKSFDEPARPPVKRVCIGRQFDQEADVRFRTPGLALGLAAQVMRFDGIILWLCEDPATAPADPTVELLLSLANKIAIPK